MEKQISTCTEDHVPRPLHRGSHRRASLPADPRAVGEFDQLARQETACLSVARCGSPGIRSQFLVRLQGDGLGESDDCGSNGDCLDHSGHAGYAVGLDFRCAPRIWLGECRHSLGFRGSLRLFLFPKVEE